MFSPSPQPQRGSPSMLTSHTNLAVYLNDHLAGAIAAIEILDMLSRHTDSADLSQFVAELRVAVDEDREELERLMSRADIAKSTGRRVAGWISEKAAELKVRIDDPLGGALQLFE